MLKRLFSGLLLLCLLFLTVQKGYSGEKLPNFIIIFTDDMGYGDLSCYGNKLTKTPNIDRLAEEGIRFTDFYAGASLCTPSRAALLTGTYPVRNSMATNFRGECVCFPVDEMGLNPKELTIAELLKQKDYKTALIGKWHLGDQEEFLPTRQGFDYYYGVPYSNDTGEGRFKWRGNNQTYDQPKIPLLRNETVIEQPVVQNTLTQRYTNEAAKFIKDNKRNPFFLYYAHTMPHYPISVSDGFKDKSGNGLYGDVIEEIDWSVGEIIKTLEELIILENTIIIFTSDNGAPRTYKEASNGGMSGYKGSHMEGGYRVPMVVSWRGSLPEGKISNQLSSVMDLLPTIAHIAGIDLPQDRVIDGMNIYELFTNPEEAESPHAYFAYYLMDQMKAIRVGDWKLHLPLDEYIDMWGKDLGPRKSKLYNLKDDIGENIDLSGKLPDKVEEMMVMARMAGNWIGDRNKPTPNSRPAGFVEKPVPLLMKIEN
jgi:arylsulfatase A-like enzyme